MKVWSSLKFILVAIPKIDAVFANDDQMEFDCDDECRVELSTFHKPYQCNFGHCNNITRDKK